MEKESPVPGFASDIFDILNGAGVTAFAQDLDLKYRWLKNPPASWGSADPTGKDDSGILPPSAAAIAVALKREVLSSGRPQWGDLVIETNGSASYFELFVDAERDAAATITGLRGIAIDVTDRRKQAETLEAVARDLSHRTKNLLAVIQSLAVQTARHAGSIDAFIDQFRGRIQSISRSQDISIGARKHGAKLSELVETQVAPYFDGTTHVTFKGIDCYLSPNAALHVGLALYELCIAVARNDDGAKAGEICVVAEAVPTDGSDGGTPLRLTWHENGTAGPIDGFGRVLLERVVPAAVGGQATLAKGDADYTLTIDPREYDCAEHEG